MAGIHVNFEISPDQFLVDLTEASYRVVLKHGFKVPFIDVELDLYEALQNVMRKDMKVSSACGTSSCCQEASHLEPWSEEGKRIFQEKK